MPYTEFNPMGNPGDPGRTYMAAGQAQMSLMEKAQAMRQRDEAMAMQRAKWEVEAPVMAAEAQSKLLEYGATLKERQRTAGLYAEFAQNTDQMQQDLTEAMASSMSEDGKPNWEGTFHNLQQVRAKWNKYSMLPQAQGWFKNVDLEGKFAFDRAVIEQKANSSLAIARERMGKPSDRTGALTQEEIDEFDAQTGKPSGFQVGDVKRISRTPYGISIGEPAVQYQPPSAQGDVKMYQEQGQQRAQKASQFLTDIDTAAEKGMERRAIIGNILDSYRSGAITGAGTSEINMVRGFLVRAGVANADELARDEQVESYLDRLVVEERREFGKGTGALSDGETAMFVRATANPNRTPAANIAILSFMDEAAARSQKLQQYALNLRIENPQMSDYEIHMRTLAERNKNPLSSAQKMLEVSAQNRGQSTSRKSGSVAQPQFDSQSLIQQARKNVQGQ